ncbi:hypothetical protein A4H02_03030 [Fervidobacterium thailandense]|uniref:Uncharacterized protein n=1 Tax=Fervidobacterium thailandense TaxID=1008305 RepID=A0A1E3G532_9BACT|nr:hypothetical protein A4H02_03030 [Fervidobacterium thailandense]
MKRLEVFVLILLITVFTSNMLANSDIFSFVHKDYDFVLRFSKGGSWYQELKKVTFFKFVLDRKGLGFEDAFLRLLEDMKYRTGIDPEVVTDAISSDVLFASKGLDVNLMEFVAFDLNYYFELIKTLASNAIVVFETKNPQKLPRALAYLLSLSYKQVGTNYIIGDSLFCGVSGRYLVVAGSKQALELALKTYATPEMQLARSVRDFDRLRAGTFLVSGYAKPGALKLEMPGTGVVKWENAEQIIFYSTASAGSFNFTIEQRNKTKLVSKKSSDAILELPNAWNYYMVISSQNTENVIASMKSWFKGTEGELTKLISLFEYLTSLSTSVYTTGRIETGEFLFIFDNFVGKDFEVQLSKVGARGDVQKQEWYLQLGATQLHIFKYSNKFFVGLLSKERYLQLERTRKKLKDFPIFNDFARITNYEFKVFIDVGDLVKSTLGFTLSSKLVFWSYNSDYFTFYRIVLS